MNWIISSLLMFASSVVLYLFVRKSSLEKNPPQFNNLAMFLIPLFVFVAIAISTHQNFLIPWQQLLIIAGIGIFFSYLGNLFSLKSIEFTPNPGYSLVISKSYVVFTTLVSVLFFRADFSLRKGLAILLIIGFSALILLSQKNLNKATKNVWLPLAMGAFFCWGLLSLSSKYLFSQGLNLYVFLSYVYFIVSICTIANLLKQKVSITLIKKNPILFLLIGLSSAGFNLFQFLAIKLAPNIGYVNAINAASISAVTIFAILLFKDEFSKKKLFGVFGVTVGLLLLLS